MRTDPPTIEYTRRRQAEGKTRREIIRCLKRHIAREIHHLLTNPTPTPHGNDLRLQRHQARQTLTDVAQQLQVHPTLISLLERGLHHNHQLATRYQQWLNLNPPIHVPKTNPDQGDLRDPPLTGSCSSSQDRTILTNSYRRRSGGISTISPCPLRAPHRWIQAKHPPNPDL